MIKITIWKTINNDIIEYLVNGHSTEEATLSGDKYCAAVSSLTQVAARGIQNVANLNCSIQSASGHFHLRLIDHPNKESNAILLTMVMGLKELHYINPNAVEVTINTIANV